MRTERQLHDTLRYIDICAPSLHSNALVTSKVHRNGVSYVFHLNSLPLSLYLCLISCVNKHPGLVINYRAPDRVSCHPDQNTLRDFRGLVWALINFPRHIQRLIASCAQHLDDWSNKEADMAVFWEVDNWSCVTPKETNDDFPKTDFFPFYLTCRGPFTVSCMSDTPC